MAIIDNNGFHNNQGNTSSQDEKQQEKERADANNAENIKNAADVAIASKHPYGMIAGGAVKGLDKLTHGKSTKALGKVMTKVNRAVPIVGNKVQDASNKLSESGTSDAIGKAASLKSGAPGKADTLKNAASGQGKNEDIGSRNLKNSLSDQSKKSWNQGLNNSGGSKENGSSDEKKDDNNEENQENEETLIDNDTKKKIKRKLFVKIAMVSGSLFAVYFFVILIAAIITGGNIFRYAPVALPKKYGTEGFETITSKDSPSHQEEIDFYEKIKAVTEANPDVNINYVLAILFDIYYDYDYDSSKNRVIDESELEILTEKELEKRQEEIKETGGIDYVKLKNNVDKFVNIIKNTGSDDYSIGGTIYQALKENGDFKKYYKAAIESYKDLSEEKALDKILENIFNLGLELEKDDEGSDPVITDETGVAVTDETDSGGSAAKQMSINDYLSGSMYATLDSVENPELVKAYTIAASTNIVANNKQLTINSNTASVTGQTCSTEKGCSYDQNGRLVDGPSSTPNGKNTYVQNGQYYYKLPMDSETSDDLNRTLNSVFGNVLVNSDGTYPTLDLNKLNSPSYADIYNELYPDTGSGNGDYKKILTGTYGNYTIKNVGEGSYVLDASYGTKLVKKDVVFYDQNDYPGKYCGTEGLTIKGSGCGVVAMAIVVSTYENNRKYDPTWANGLATKNGHCGSDGTSYAHFTSTAKEMGYKSTLYSKTKANGWKISKLAYNNILKKLSEGNLIIINVMKGNFTNGGHYMVLGGINPNTKEVYVYDPNNANNSKAPRNTGTGWYSFNDIIAPQTKAYIIIEKG